MPFPDDKKQEAKDSFMECAEGESLNLDEIPKHSDLKQVQRFTIRDRETQGIYLSTGLGLGRSIDLRQVNRSQTGQ